MENKESQQLKPSNPEAKKVTTHPRKNEKLQKSTSISHKNAHLKIDREQILEYPQSQLPTDAQFKGYEEVIVQDITLTQTCRPHREFSPDAHPSR